MDWLPIKTRELSLHCYLLPSCEERFSNGFNPILNATDENRSWISLADSFFPNVNRYAACTYFFLCLLFCKICMYISLVYFPLRRCHLFLGQGIIRPSFLYIHHFIISRNVVPSLSRIVWLKDAFRIICIYYLFFPYKYIYMYYFYREI